MSEPAAAPPDGTPAVAAGVRATYNAIANAYDRELSGELDGKPVDRAMLEGFAELAGDGLIADIGCGPGHVTRFLAARGAGVIGLDLSDGMIAVARQRAPGLPFAIADMRALPAPDGAWAGVAALYSVIHLTPDGRAAACREFARVLRPGGWALIAFHVESAETAMGEVHHLTTWFGSRVEVDGYFLDPAAVTADLAAAGLRVWAKLDREPHPGAEHPSRRCYLLAQRG